MAVRPALPAVECGEATSGVRELVGHCVELAGRVIEVEVPGGIGAVCEGVLVAVDAWRSAFTDPFDVAGGPVELPLGFVEVAPGGAAGTAG